MKQVLLLVLNNFKNDSRVLKEAISLKKGGYDVQVVALHDRGQKVHEKIEEIPVHRIELKSRNWSKKSFVQLLKYIEFTYRVLKNYRKYEIIHCNDLNTLPIGVLIKFLHKDAKIVYDAHEYETEMNGLSGFLKSAVKFLERSLIKYADRVITVSNAIAEEYVRLYGIQKPALVFNTPFLQYHPKRDYFRKEFGIGKKDLIFLYQGSLAPGRGVEIVLDAFKEFSKKGANHTIENSDVVPCVVFMGYGPLEERIKESSKEYSNIYFHEAVAPDILLEYTSSADFGISFIEDCCLSYRYCLPNKMFEYLMAELPVIVSNLPEMKHFVETKGVGLVVDTNSAEGLVKSIQVALNIDRESLLKNIKSVKEHFHWEAQEQVLLELYRGIESV